MKKQSPHLATANNRPSKAAAWLLPAAALLTWLTVSSQAQVPVFSNVWILPAGTYADLLSNAGNNVRGIAISPVTTNVLYFSSTGGTNNGNSHVSTVAFASGSNFLANLDGTGVSGGTVGTEGVRVSDDGFVYGVNLSGAPASNFKIYRWPSDTDTATAPKIVFDSGLGTSFQWRIGDYMDLRGSGSNTELVVVGNGSGANITTNFVIFRPTDDTATTFTNFSITIPGSTTVNFCGAGVAFEGTNNALWLRRAGSQETRRVVYSPEALSAAVTATNTVDQSACQGLKYLSANGVNMLATVQAATGLGAIQRARVFTIPASPTGPFVSALSANLTALPTSNNGNGLGNVDAQNGYLAFGAPGHGIALFQLGFVTNAPPTVAASPAGATVVQGFNYTMNSSASGTAPLSYQWYFETNTLLANATNSSVTLSNLQSANAGSYSVVVTNPYGSATSALATVTILPAGSSRVATQIWSLAPTSRTYLTTDNTQRGMAYDGLSQRVVLVSRTPTNGVHLLDAATGADLGEMDQTYSATGPGTFAINLAGVADDGVVYACNLTTAADATAFAIYSWPSASNTVETATTQGSAFIGNLASAGRVGDTFAARGAGPSTELLAAYRTGTNVALFNTTDGINFSPNILAVTNLPADAVANGFAGLGVAFGPTNTFWAKSVGFNLRLVQYDVAALTANVIATFTNVPITEAPIGVDNANNLLAAIGVIEIPQNLALYDLSASDGPALTDRELFPSDNGNANGTGVVAFDVAGGRVFSLDSNNGLMALKYAPRLFQTMRGANTVLTWTGPGALQSDSNVAGPYADVLGATSPYTNTLPSPLFFRVRR